MLQIQTLQFLRELRDNNNRDWFEANRKRYLSAKSDLEQLVMAVIGEFSHHDPSIAMQTPKECMFRINRDVRFSKDKSPYKINMSFSINSGGKKSQTASYYIHLQPDNQSFIGGGLYMSMPPVLKKIRTEIAYAPDEFMAIVEHPDFVKTFGTCEMPGQKNVKVPNGFDPKNKAAEYLKLKSFVGTHSVTDEQITSPGFVHLISETLSKLTPMIKFLDRGFIEDEQ